MDLENALASCTLIISFRGRLILEQARHALKGTTLRAASFPFQVP